MSKYKVGDKVLLKCEVCEINNKYDLNVGVRFDNDTLIYIQDKYLQKDEKTYSDGLNDAWELARKIENKLGSTILEPIFGSSRIADILDNFTPQEALAKIEAYEKSKQIQIGDVVEFEAGTIAVVTRIQEGYISVCFEDGGAMGFKESEYDLKKTGRHIDILSILEQIRGDE